MKRGDKHSIAAWLLVFVILLVGSAQAAETWISSARAVSNPGKAALLPDGGLAVASPVWNSIGILDRNAKALRSLSSKHPSAVAVGPNGNLYVAVSKYSSNTPPYITKGEVKVFDSSFTYLFSLGSGAGEFVNPTDVEVAANGTIFVPDAAMNVVKAFNPDGSLKFSFGSYGIGDGFFNKPLSVSVDNATGDIYVADCQVTQNTTLGTGDVDGVRIQVYDANRTLKKGFGTTAELQSVSDIKFFNDKLYVADNYLDQIMVYDTVAGVLDHSFSNADTSIRMPSSLAISPDGILYVTGTGSNDVNLFGIDGYLLFSVAPGSLQFVAIEGLAAPAPKNITVSNTGNGDLNWSITNETWMTSSLGAGSLIPGAAETVAIGVNQAGLAAGNYTGKVSVKNQNGTAEYVSVTLDVIAPPAFSLSQSAITLTGDAGTGAVLTQVINVALNGALPASYWTASTTQAWLGVNPVQAGTIESAVTISANTAGLAVGTYNGQVVFASQDPAGVSAIANITLTLGSSGTINVKTKKNGRKGVTVVGSTAATEPAFTITGDNGTSFSGTGESWTATKVPDGTYTITYGSIPGFLTPKSETLAITEGGAIEFNGTYIDISAANNIIVSPGFSVKAPATIRVFSPDGLTLIKEFNPFGSGSKVGYNVGVGDIDGDGIKDILVGLGDKNKFQARVAAFTNNGDPITGADFVALDTKKGANVASGDFDGDGKDEIIVAAGSAPANAAQVKIFSYDTATFTIVETGVDITAFASKFGANIAVGDINGDGKPELIVAPGPDPYASPEVKAYSIDTSGGLGSWTAVETGLDILPFSGKCGANIAAGDLDADGKAEIVAASGTCADSKNRIMAFYGDGSAFPMTLNDTRKGGLEVSVGDLDLDGKADIVTSLGKRGNNNTLIRMYNSNGDMISSFTAFEGRTHFGAKTALGELGY